MNDLRTAAQQALEVLEFYRSRSWQPTPASDAITVLRAALAEPVQEPVAWLTGCPECGMDGDCGCPSGTYNTPQREPLTAESIEQAIGYRLPEYAMQALLKLLNTKPGHCDDCGKTLIQMAEPERKPLTDEEIERVRQDAQRYRWLAARLLAADFNYGGEGVQTLVFEMPNGCAVSADCNATIDAAMAKKADVPETDFGNMAVAYTLTDEIIADLWHQNAGFHHHFARAVERWLKGQA